MLYHYAASKGPPEHWGKSSCRPSQLVIGYLARDANSSIKIKMLDYLKIILTWPVLGAGLLLWFAVYYRKEIRRILSEARLKKIGGTEFGQAEVSEITAENVQLETTESNPNWELMFYGKAVAGGTALSLRWLYSIGSATRLNFFQNMTVAPESPDINVEKEAQFSTMLSYKFIEQVGELYKVTPKGEEFLRFYRFIN